MRGMHPVGNVIGRLTAVFGASLLVPAALDWADGSENWRGSLLASFLTIAGGVALTMLTSRDRDKGLSRKQAVLLTVLLWVVLPIFGALPFMFGAPHTDFTTAFFEAMSGLTTTGATAFDLENAPRGMLLWRSMLQWFGGVGIAIFAMVFLPVLKIGGMQFFRSEAFDLSGTILPRATEVAGQLGIVYLFLTGGCIIGYSATGMTPFEAIAHAMTTVSTGGFSTYNDGFGVFSEGAHYVSVLFMWLAAWPFIRFIQLGRGSALPLWRDSQIRAFVGIILTVTTLLVVWLTLHSPLPFHEALIEALFNATSVMTGTGYASDNYSEWGGFAVAIFFIIAMIGGCTGSTACSAKVFRYQILLSALRIQLLRIHAPHGVHVLRYQGHKVEDEVLSSIMGFFMIFAAALAGWAVLLSLTGLDTITSLSGSVAVLTNVGPGLGEMIGPVGNYGPVPDSAKWLMSAGMLLGRLEFMSVLVLFTPLFWRR